MNPIQQLESLGQSVWLDYIRRNLLTGGELAGLIRDDGIMGVTSNPAIFEKAIAGSTDYTDAIATLAGDTRLDTKGLYEKLAIEDIQQAADILKPVYTATDGRDGYVSIEVSPRLAHDEAGTLAEARRLWQTIGRSNLMIKVPATPAGLPAIEALLAEGINVNVTLLFAVPVYEQVVEHYLRGLERRAAAGHSLNPMASVASFFVSRVDSAVDKRLEVIREQNPNAETVERLDRLQGQAAIANARLAYQRYLDLFSGARWEALQAKGARSQRLLWASTGVKNPAYSDVLYIEELIGADTVNTVPPATLDAYRDHGEPRVRLTEDLAVSQAILDELAILEIPMDAVTDELLEQGLELFVVAFDKLLAAVETARGEYTAGLVSRQQASLPEALQSQVSKNLEDWQQNNKVHRLWARDPWLWTGKDENQWLDWLDITCEQVEHLGDLQRLFQFAEGRYFKHAVLLGMGGSSLAPDVLRQTFGVQPAHPDWIILDSTDPAQVRAVEAQIDYAHTLFLISSKSGSTLEPNILKAYFYTRACEELGEKKAGYHFGAVTDPGSSLEKVARTDNFRRIFYGKPRIGGRYSALSNFGMVPAAVMGLDMKRFLDRTVEMVEACAACVPAADNPGVMLGLILGTAACDGRDKLTLIASPGIASLGAWLEQLIAESTGKEGKAIIPVDGESLVEPQGYGTDRLFVYLRLEDAADPAQDAAMDKLEAAGQPVIRIAIQDIYDLGQEFFRWEIATAVAGALMNINPFDQPDVEASKIVTRELTDAYEASGALPEETPLVSDEHFKLYTDADNARALEEISAADDSVAGMLKAHLGRVKQGDYFAVLAYLNRIDPAHEAPLQAMRHAVRDSCQVATCLGYGPRFLHSTGQAYKGGPNSGVFLQITCDDAADLPVPGHQYSFGIVKAAQARGDFAVLAERKRRALRVHLGSDTAAGLQKLQQLVEQALRD